ncbi:MAG: epoxyqueuosine reductase [Clostridia bacterium]|nr:epoxyqueuosine reductase [Clostridia bacterium]
MLNELVSRPLREEHIEYAAALPYEACRLLRPYLVERLSPFVPRTVILFLVPYYAGRAENLSCYASARDYHGYMKGLFARVIPRMQAESGCSFFGFADHSPIDERLAAAQAGLGMRGENGLLIHPRYGSFVFIGELLTDMPPEAVGAISPQEVLPCLSCGACARACPTGFLRGEGAECLSAITQKKGELTEQEVALVRAGGSVWGCDCCQLVCPHNVSAMREEQYTPIPYFREERITHLTKACLAAMTAEEFAARAFSFRGRTPLLRNLDLLDT